MRFRSVVRTLTAHRWRPGWCPTCRRATAFVHHGPWPRDDLRCQRCGSIPRWRALVHVLQTRFPEWRDLRTHEFAPAGAASDYLAREGRHHTVSQYWPEVEPGTSVGGVRCEDLHALTFPDASLDLVVTQDVLEHLLEPERAIGEIDRVLRPGGAHLFTVPIFDRPSSLIRARFVDGALRQYQPPEHHGDPASEHGALVATEWGADIVDLFRPHSPMDAISITVVQDKWRGIIGPLTHVGVVWKPPAG